MGHVEGRSSPPHFAQFRPTTSLTIDAPAPSPADIAIAEQSDDVEATGATDTTANELEYQLFVGGIGRHITEERLMEIFGVELCALARDPVIDEEAGRAEVRVEKNAWRDKQLDDHRCSCRWRTF